MFPVIKAGEDVPSLPAFIVGKNGIFLRTESRLGVSTTQVNTINHLDEIQPELEWALPKIPASVIGQIVGFLHRCDKEKGGEGALLICLDDKDEWALIVPRQDNSGADVRYYIDPDTVPPGWTLIGTVHSHPWSGTPNPSMTDESDDKKLDGLHIIAGNLGDNPKFNVAAVINGTRFRWQDVDEVLEVSGPLDVPDEWLDQVKKKGWVKKVTTAVTGGGGWSSYTYKKTLTPRAGETPLGALLREREWSFNMIDEDAEALGLKVKWTVTDEHGKKVKNSTIKALREAPKVTSSTTGFQPPTPPVPMSGNKSEPVQMLAVPDDDIKPVERWTGIEPDECEQQHPGRLCKTNCGCHCEPCREKTVGAYNPAGHQGFDGHAFDEWRTPCECTDCFKPEGAPRSSGCDGWVPDDRFNPSAKYGSLRCDDCLRGSHYENKGAVADSRTPGWH